MTPLSPLPYSGYFSDSETYVESLLDFAASSDIFQILCGGVHILDFFTREPDLYASVLPRSWREWFQEWDVEDVLDLLMREDLDQFATLPQDIAAEGQQNQELSLTEVSWRGGRSPPTSLLRYIRDIRKHLLRRDFQIPATSGPECSMQGNLTRKIAVGMKPKKIHEVLNFSRYVDKLASEISRDAPSEITHLVDFGSGQNYLGRALASHPYHRHIVAVESKRHNIEGAKSMDVTARLAEKEKLMRHKREYRKYRSRKDLSDSGGEALDGCSTTLGDFPEQPDAKAATGAMARSSFREAEIIHLNHEGKGSIQYIEHMIDGGDLSPVAQQIEGISRVADHRNTAGPAEGRTLVGCDGLNSSDNDQGLEKHLSPGGDVCRDEPLDDPKAVNGGSRTIPHQQCHADIPATPSPPQSLMIISLHSCGNLVHHALRSLILTPSVTAVAVVGCCYNLMTERLGPPTYKLPTLRPRPNPRVVATSAACDPAGFPMSERLSTYSHKHGQGIRLNITARMMAVQAPQNWTPADSADFFTRHFFRALLQRIFLDRGVVSAPSAPGDIVGGSPANPDAMGTEPIIIGSLRKACYSSFPSYVRGAVAKLSANDPVRGPVIASLMSGLTDDDIAAYHARYLPRKRDLSVVWSLMAFSAGVVEAIIVLDRWLFLKEQQHVVKDAWVETVFDYRQSPRNFVVVGIKERKAAALAL
ncbi:hypothetical protein GP486_006098 [Trichoglossum hirsutum]|uniref:Methyltransferase domain-containing protein n=1 Tax=Trichoglossum hirsutum TaxID=265104 RepID=A0A9P8L7Z6_9PEZI|nr:hypothetical protein GP486_006098 [Trichoglossum hirsutum]